MAHIILSDQVTTPGMVEEIGEHKRSLHAEKDKEGENFDKCT